MFVTLIRTIILYLVVIATMRIMGKRQIGELQPTELVVTILLSEIVAIPMQDNDIPLVNTFIPVFVLVGFEILISIISLKSVRFRSLMQGNSLIIIRNGIIDQQQIKRLRYSVDDILEALRRKDVFDISQVQYAIAETNGEISVMLKSEYSPVIRSDLKLKPNDDTLPCVVIADGEIIQSDFKDCGMTMEKLQKIIKNDKINVKETLLMTIDKNGKKTVIGRNMK